MFTIFDIVIFVIVTISSMSGLHNGLLNIIVNLTGFIISILLALFVFPYIKSVLVGNLENELLVSVLSGIIAYICALFAVTILTSWISRLLKPISGGFFDRTFGLIVGILRGIALSVIIFAVIAVFVSGTYLKAKNAKELVLLLDREKHPSWLARSKTTDYLEDFLKRSISLMPDGFLESIKLPKVDNHEDGDIIDSIKKSKSDG